MLSEEYTRDRFQNRMTKKVYIAIGNHRSFAGIKEIVYTIQSSLSAQFSVELSRELKGDCVNIVIDEFSGLFDVMAIKKVTELYSKTKIVVVATEFSTPVSILGVELFRTFNFFGTPRDWSRLFQDVLKSLAVGVPPYMRQRYLGFAQALKYCNLLTTIHPLIVPAAAELAKGVAPNLPAPLMIYPQIGQLSQAQQDRLWSLPVGFTMTGTQTPYRVRILRELVRKFKRLGWSTPLYQNRAFGAPRSSTSSADVARQAQDLASILDYDTVRPDFLFNVNPPQSAKWAYSSPMRILRAMLLGQIPVITKRFRDHPLEDVAASWDGKSETAIELASWQFVDRRAWLPDYVRSIEAYDRRATEGNAPFVNAVRALADDSEYHPAASAMRESAALQSQSRTGQLAGQIARK